MSFREDIFLAARESDGSAVSRVGMELAKECRSPHAIPCRVMKHKHLFFPHFGPANAYQSTGGWKMLHYAVVFLIIALLAGLFGFFGVAGLAASIAKVLFVIFLVMFLVSFITGRRSV